MKNLNLISLFLAFMLAYSCAYSNENAPEILDIFDNISKIKLSADSNNSENYLNQPIVILDNNSAFANFEFEGSRNQSGVYIGVPPEEFKLTKGFLYYNNKTTYIIPFSEIKKKSNATIYLTHCLLTLFQTNEEKIDLNILKRELNYFRDLEARFWLKLEWNALREAIKCSAQKRKEALQHALFFRKYRQDLYVDSAYVENTKLSYEGFAEYKSLELNYSNEELKNLLIDDESKLSRANNISERYGSFSGAMYCYLINDARKGKVSFNSYSDLIEMVKADYKLNFSELDYKDVEEIAVSYHSARVMSEELDRLN
ncbi:MAG: hypothetical protein N4A49_05575 [Marinifilaceae bacterium]|jgi:hypothetical protein|nr:hypothetical protein [Marinifilaceae bacterium]